MKDILSLWLCHTLLIFVLKHIPIYYAVDASELDDLARSNYEEPNSNNRRGYYGESDVNRANQYYEEAYDDAARRTNQYENKFSEPANLRKLPYLELRKAYNTALGYGNTRNGDTREINVTTSGTSSAKIDESNVSIIHEGGLANNTAFGSVATIVKSNILKPSAGSCTCQGSGANEEVSFLCFSSKDSSKNLSIKYKGMIMFNLEDIIKAYKFYYDNMKIHNFNFDNILNSESNLKHEFKGDNKFNFDVSKFKMNEGSFNFNAESKFDINELKKGDNKFKVNTFNKFDMNVVKEDSQEIEKYFNANLEKIAKQEHWDELQELADSIQNGKFIFDNNFNSNQFTLESDVQADAQAEIEAYAKALAEAKAIKNAQIMLEAQAQLQAEAKAQEFLQAQVEAKVQTIMQNQIMAQAQAEAQAKSKAETYAKVQAQAKQNAQSQSQFYGIGQTQVNSQSQSHAHLNNAVNLGGGGEKKIFGNGFNLGFNGAFGVSKSSTSYGKQAGGAFSIGGGGSGAIGLGVGGGGAIGLGGGGSAAIDLGVGGEGVIGLGGGGSGAIGLGLGGGGAIGLGGGGSAAINLGVGGGGATSLGGRGSGAIGLSVGGGGTMGLGGRVPFTGRPAVGSNNGLGMGSVMAYTGGEVNYGDTMYYESADDGYSSAGYPGVLAFPAPSPNSGGRLYNDGSHHKDKFSAFGVSGYQRYP